MHSINDKSSEDEEYQSDSDDLDETLQNLKPGLYVEEKPPKVFANNVKLLLTRTEEIKLDLPWVERMDMINELAPMAPELAMQLEKHEQKRANTFIANKKIPYIDPTADPILNDFKREMLFHRQAQQAVLDGIPRLHGLGIASKRPDDYFAEMAKSDDHMQKVRSNLMAKQEGQAKSERVKHLREQRKVGKILQKQVKVKREAEKKDMLDHLKKFRKGKLKNLDFLDDDKGKSKSGGKKLNENRAKRDKKFGFGGKKKGIKRNSKDSAGDLSSFKRKFNNPKPGGGKRLGKSRRVSNQNKSKGRGNARK